MKIILDEKVSVEALRADQAWDLFFKSKSSLAGESWLKNVKQIVTGLCPGNPST
jgi:hypothetical protein